MGTNRVVERSLALGFPHHSVEFVMAKPVFHQSHEEVARIWIVEAGAAAGASVEIDFRDLIEARHQPRIVGLFEQAVRLHSARSLSE